jgi:hypothetical protein
MEKSFLRSAAWETGKTALSATAFSMFALAIVAVIVKAAAPAEWVIRVCNWTVKCLGVFAFSLLFIKRERALFKGLAAGIFSVVLTMLLFAAIGGGFHVTWFFPLELFVCALLGGAGALLGAKLRKN